MVSHSLPLPGRPAGSGRKCGGISLISPELGGGYVGQGAAILFTCGPATIQDRGLACCYHAGLLLRRLRCWSQPRFPFSCSQPQPSRRKAGRAPARSRTSPSWRVVFTSEKPLDGELSLVAPDGSVAAKSRKRFGGPPYFWFAEAVAPAAGKWRANLASSDCGNVGREIAVRADQPQRPQTAAGSVWPVRNAWDRGMESLFSAWVEKLFDAPLDAAPSWPALHEVLRDKSRNVLFNHLGLGEDEMKIVLRPDCADLPYFLRSYFAFKMGLPFGFSKCSRGGAGKPPKCFGWASIQANEGAKRPGLAATFGDYMRVVADGVHSGTGRTPAADD